MSRAIRMGLGSGGGGGRILPGNGGRGAFGTIFDSLTYAASGRINFSGLGGGAGGGGLVGGISSGVNFGGNAGTSLVPITPYTLELSKGSPSITISW